MATLKRGDNVYVDWDVSPAGTPWSDYRGPLANLSRRITRGHPVGVYAAATRLSGDRGRSRLVACGPLERRAFRDSLPREYSEGGVTLRFRELRAPYGSTSEENMFRALVCQDEPAPETTADVETAPVPVYTDPAQEEADRAAGIEHDEVIREYDQEGDAGASSSTATTTVTAGANAVPWWAWILAALAAWRLVASGDGPSSW